MFGDGWAVFGAYDGLLVWVHVGFTWYEVILAAAPDYLTSGHDLLMSEACWHSTTFFHGHLLGIVLMGHCALRSWLTLYLATHQRYQLISGFARQRPVWCFPEFRTGRHIDLLSLIRWLRLGWLRPLRLKHPILTHDQRAVLRRMLLLYWIVLDKWISDNLILQLWAFLQLRLLFLAPIRVILREETHVVELLV